MDSYGERDQICPSYVKVKYQEGFHETVGALSTISARRGLHNENKE